MGHLALTSNKRRFHFNRKNSLIMKKVDKIGCSIEKISHNTEESGHKGITTDPTCCEYLGQEC